MGVGDEEIVDVFVEGIVARVVFAVVIDIDLAFELPVLEPLGFEAEAIATDFDVVAPDVFVVTYVFVV